LEENLLTFQKLKPGIQQVTLNVKALYPEEGRRKTFEKKYLEFLNSASVHSRIFDYTGDSITYRTECIIPTKHDQRPPLLLVFGNPASHSVDSEMFFASEGKGREHRIWNILNKAGIISFPSIANVCSMNERNKLKKNDLYELSYCSPFRISLTVYHTMPSPASDKNWAGLMAFVDYLAPMGSAK
jgi:hypothetical protein